MYIQLLYLTLIKYSFIILFLSFSVHAESFFVNSCKQPKSNLIQKQIQWLKIIYANSNCVEIEKKIQKENYLTNIIPGRFSYISEYNNLFIPYELIETGLDFNKHKAEWIETQDSFEDLSIFKEFKNIKHLFNHFGGKGICKILQDLPSIESIAMRNTELDIEEVECIQSKNIKIYIIDRFFPNQTTKIIKNNIYGISDYQGEIKDLYQYKNLSYLGLVKNYGVLDLKVLTANKNLSNLNLNISNSSEIENIRYLRNLKFLTLSCLQPINFERNNTLSFSNLTFLENLIFMKGLDVSNCELKSISSLKTILGLESLILRNNSIETIDELSALKNLKVLDISGNKIRSLNNLTNLKNLEYLNLAWNRIKTIGEIKQFKKLEYLNLSNNPFEETITLPPLKNLKVLKIESVMAIDGNERDSLHDIARISRIEFSNSFLMKKLLSEDDRYDSTGSLNEINFNTDVTKFKNIEFISLRNLLIEDQTKFKNLDSLKYLDLSSSNISENQIDLNRLKGLKYLSLKDNRVAAKTVAKKIELPNLEFLDISNNDLRSLESITISKSIISLEMNESQLTVLPKINASENILFLELRSNNFKDIDLSAFKNLFQVDLRDNQIKKITHSTSLELIYTDESTSHLQVKNI